MRAAQRAVRIGHVETMTPTVWLRAAQRRANRLGRYPSCAARWMRSLVVSECNARAARCQNNGNRGGRESAAFGHVAYGTAAGCDRFREVSLVEPRRDLSGEAPRAGLNRSSMSLDALLVFALLLADTTGR